MATRLLWLVSGLPLLATARLQLSTAIQSHMVLQRAPHAATIYGEANPHAHIDVILDYGRHLGSAQADAEGTFVVHLAPQQAGGPHRLRVQNRWTGERRTLHDILFGDLWICSGQSNMQFTVSSVFNKSDEIADAARYPDIRLLSVQQNVSGVELENLSNFSLPWSQASPESVGGPEWDHFSAVCYFYGRELYKRLAVPIGLISTNYGGTPIVAWSDPDAIGKCGQPPQSTTRESRNDNSPDRIPSLDLGQGSQDPSVLFNAMIGPFLSMAIKGVIWYQGEADIARPRYYECAFPAMIQNWRDRFVNSKAEGDFPFGFVQLASYSSGTLGDVDIDVGRMRVAQYAGFQVPNVFFAPSFDLGDRAGGIHPRNKQDVGSRLAAAALQLVYGDVSVPSSGPYMASVEATQGDDGVVHVKMVYGNVWDKLVYTDVKGMFEVTGANDTDSTNAVAASRVEVTDKDMVEMDFNMTQRVKTVVLRYAYRNNVCPSQEVPYYAGPTCGLYSQSGEDPHRVSPKAPVIKVIQVSSTSRGSATTII